MNTTNRLPLARWAACSNTSALPLSDFAWIGYSWSGCESQAKPFPRPAEWDGDYGGKASAPCTETGRDTGVFVRDYPKATVQWDCRKA